VDRYQVIESLPRRPILSPVFDLDPADEAVMGEREK
jgi:hypothetical protein